MSLFSAGESSHHLFCLSDFMAFIIPCLSLLQPVGRYYINPLCPSEDYVSIVGSALMTADETGRFGVKGHSAAQRERLTLEWIWPPIGSRTSPRQTAWSGQNFLLLLGILKAVMLLWKLRSTSYIHTLLNSCGKINPPSVSTVWSSAAVYSSTVLILWAESLSHCSGSASCL